MNIVLSDDLGKRLEERVGASKEFHSVEEYVSYILEEVLKQSTGDAASYTASQEQEVKERLENLGYLD